MKTTTLFRLPLTVFSATFATVFFAVSPVLIAQAPPGAATAFGKPQAAPSASNNVSAGTAGDYRSSTSEGMADRLFNVNSDSVDFENGSFQWKGRTFNLGNTRIMRARLERYLAAPVPGGEGRRYEQTLKQIETLLSPSKITKKNYISNLQRAWELLDDAATFEADANCCRTLSTLVEKTARMRRELQELNVKRNQDKYEKDLALRHVTAHETSREVREDENSGSTTTMKSKGGTTTKSTAAPKFGTAESKRRNEELLERRRELAKDEAQIPSIGLKSRIEFQSQIVAFLLERRFRHAIIATAFYRQLYQGGAQDLRTGSKQIKEMFPVSDFVPTIDSVDMLAREAINDVDVGMKAIRTLYDNGERFGAFERIQETFFLGEYVPSVMYFDPEKKKTLREIWATARDLQRMGDDRDLSGVEGAIKKIKASADDFPSAQIMSKVNNAKQASDLELLAAENAALSKDTNKATQHLSAATKIWPTNPGIRDFATKVRNHGNQLALMVPEFDRLVAEGNLRSIYNRAQEFGLALITDQARAQTLKNIVGKLGKIDGLLLQARLMHKRGGADTYMAWDLLQEAEAFEPNDPELGKARSELAPAASAYTALLGESERNEKEGNYSAALVAMLEAQELNQVSEVCRRSVQRLSNSLMESLTTKN